MHLLAWPFDLGNLSDCSHEHFLLFVGTKPLAQCQSGTSGEDQGGPVLWLQVGIVAYKGYNFKIKFPILFRYNSPTYCDHMLNPNILDGWEDCTLAKNHHLAKAATITGEHPETRVKEEIPNMVIRKYTSGTEGNS